MVTFRSRILLALLTVASIESLRSSIVAQEPAMDLSKGAKELASSIASKIIGENKKKIAVLPFRMSNGQLNNLCTYLPEAILGFLVDKNNVEVLERSLLDVVMSEVSYNESGYFDSMAVQKARIAGADAIVTGTITDLSSSVEVNGRLVDTKTGRVFAAASVRIVRDASVIKLLNDLITPQTPRSSPEKPTSEGKKKFTPQVQEVDQISFRLNGCKRFHDDLSCDLILINNSGNRILIIRSIEIFDKSGKSYTPSQINVGGETLNILGSIHKYMVPEAEIPGRIVVHDLPTEIDYLLEIKINARADITDTGSPLDMEGISFVVSFRHIPLD